MGFTLCKSFNIVILVPKVLPKSYFRNYNLPCLSYIHLFLFFALIKSFSQPASYNDRAAFFDQLEERARLLSINYLNLQIRIQIQRMIGLANLAMMADRVLKVIGTLLMSGFQIII